MQIYKITNQLTGMVYIGQTIQRLSKRFSQHCTDKRAEMPICRAIQKYGREHFTIEVIHQCSSPEELNHREAFYIEQYDCLVPRGYNLIKGGTAHGAKHPDTKAKISAALKGRQWTDEHRAHHAEAVRSESTRAKISEALRGKPRAKGRKHSEEHKAKIGATMKGRTPWNKKS